MSLRWRCWNVIRALLQRDVISCLVFICWTINELNRISLIKQAWQWRREVSAVYCRAAQRVSNIRIYWMGMYTNEALYRPCIAIGVIPVASTEAMWIDCGSNYCVIKQWSTVNSIKYPWLNGLASLSQLCTELAKLQCLSSDLARGVDVYSIFMVCNVETNYILPVY